MEIEKKNSEKDENEIKLKKEIEIFKLRMTKCSEKIKSILDKIDHITEK